MAIYVPVVKSKQTDLSAIAMLGTVAMSRIKPLLEPPVSLENKVAVTDVAKAASDAFARLPAVPFYFDPLNYEAEFRQLSAVRQLLSQGREITPTFGLNRLPKNLASLGTMLQEFGPALAIRIDLHDLTEVPEDVWESIISYTGQVGVSPERLELFLDFQQVDAMRERKIIENVLDFLLLQPKNFAPGKVTVLGSSALASVAEVKTDGEKSVRRIERNIWATLNYELAGTRAVRFGDYGVINPRFAFSGPNPNANAKIRYAVGGELRVFRGHGLYNPGRFEQYFDLTKRVVDSGVFMGRDFSFGDNYIAACAEREVGTGNLGIWVKVDTNHHIEFVSRQTDFILNNLSSVEDTADLTELLVEA